ncbi:internal scaffolding protein [Apis mellifera associated microvirus 22]|nr:internal scaffolding protein [Apis mellifera associated microvirus 22]
MKEVQTRPNGTTRVRTINIEPTRTQTQFKDQCDINQIIAKYKKTGEITHLSQKKGAYIDVSEIQDYQSALNVVLKAEEAFLTLPADLRKKFDNDPTKLISFLEDPKNDPEAIELGIKNKPQTNELNPKPNEPNPS